MKRKIFPNLVRTAQRFLVAPLGSVSSGREFKVGKRVNIDTHTRFLQQNAEMLLWLNYNVHAGSYITFSILKEYKEFKNKHNDAVHEYQLSAKLDILLQPSDSENSDCVMKETNLKKYYYYSGSISQ